MESSGRPRRPLQIAPGRILLWAEPVLRQGGFSGQQRRCGVGFHFIDGAHEGKQLIKISLRQPVELAGNEFAFPHDLYGTAGSMVPASPCAIPQRFDPLEPFHEGVPTPSD